jgi:hypothetical protein
MSATKRTTSQADNRPILLATLGCIEARQKWRDQFLDNLSGDRTASRAWKMLTGAGLDVVALPALWFYAHPPDRKKEEHNLQYIVSKIKALIRELKIEVERRNAGDPRTALFSERRLSLERELLSAKQPFAFDGSTVGEWLTQRLLAGKPICNLPEMREVYASLGPRCPISDRKFWLYILRCYASNAGITLGAGRLAELANCSDPNSHESDLSPRTLARQYKLFSSQVSADCSAIRDVPPPLPLVPPQNF